MANPPRYRIVIALDQSEYAQIVLEHALDQAVRHDAPDLHFLTVVDSERGVDSAKRDLAMHALDGLDAFRGDRPDWRTHLHVRSGNPATEIVQLAAEIDADLLVIGRYSDRTIADKIVDNAPCPTLVVGLSGHALEPNRCEACVQVREDSDGEHWFCARHSGDRAQLSLRVPSSASLTGGSLMW